MQGRYRPYTPAFISPLQLLPGPWDPAQIWVQAAVLGLDPPAPSLAAARPGRCCVNGRVACASGSAPVTQPGGPRHSPDIFHPHVLWLVEVQGILGAFPPHFSAQLPLLPPEGAPGALTLGE